jgi:hypothetical protein
LTWIEDDQTSDMTKYLPLYTERVGELNKKIFEQIKTPHYLGNVVFTGNSAADILREAVDTVNEKIETEQDKWSLSLSFAGINSADKLKELFNKFLDEQKQAANYYFGEAILPQKEEYEHDCKEATKSFESAIEKELVQFFEKEEGKRENAQKYKKKFEIACTETW